MHCNNGLNNKLVVSLVENKVAEETGDLKYLQDSMYDFVKTLKEIILGEYSTEFFNKYVDEALKLHGSNLEEFLKIPKMGLELRQALNSIDVAIDTSNQEFKDNLVLLLDRFQTTLDNIIFEARDPYDTAVELGFTGTKQEWLEHLEGDSAYKLATLNGFQGTEKNWLEHLEGDSAYKIAVDNGFVGNKQNWLTSLKPTEGTLQALTKFMNNDADTEVTVPELGNIPSLQGHIKQMFENGGLPATPFKTKVEMESSGLAVGSYAVVTDDDRNTGLYIKSTDKWVKSGLLSHQAIIAARNGVKDFVRISDNLFNHRTIVESLSITETGEYLTESTYWASDFIPVEPNAIYSLQSGVLDTRGFRFVSFYDKDRQFIKRSNTLDLSSSGDDRRIKSFTTSSDTYYVRGTSNMPDPVNAEYMVVKGSDYIPYHEYKAYINSLSLGDNEISDIVDAAKSDVMSNLTRESVNLYNPDTAMQSKALKFYGTIEDAVDYSLSDFIAVEPNGEYSMSADGMEPVASPFIHVGHYTANKVFIRRVQSEPGPVSTITIPEDTYYIRLNTNHGSNYNFNRMLNKGDMALPYKPYGSFIKEDLLTIVKQPNNLYNYRNVTPSTAINVQGEFVDAPDYAISEFIEVRPDVFYTYYCNDPDKSAFHFTATYDENREFLNRIRTANRGNGSSKLTVKYDPDVKYIRLLINQGAPDEFERAMVLGTEVLEYDTGIRKLRDVTLSEQARDEVISLIGDTGNKSGKVFSPSVSFEGVFNTDVVWNGYENFARTKTAAQIYQWFDDLQANHPTYITTQELGEDAWGNRIAAYHFNPEKPPRSYSVGKKEYPKIYLTCGTHGYENLPPLTTYLLLEQMCNNWQSDPLLEALRFDMQLIVIPVVNPSGWNNHTRKNANGVDINRSFPEGFGWQSTDPSSSYYGGEEPLQELESQYVKRIFDENLDIDAFYDFHNFGGAEGRDWNIWIPTSNPKHTNPMAEALFGRMSRKWKREFDWLPDLYTWSTGYANNTHGGMIQNHAFARGINRSATFELGERWWLNTDLIIYDAVHCKTAVEALANWLLINCRDIVIDG